MLGFMRRWAPLAVMLLCAVAFLSPAILGSKVMTGTDLLLFQSPLSSERPADLVAPSNPLLYDATYVFHPDQLFARTQLRAGRLPIWNPFASAGRPLLAAQQSAPLYPLNLPLWIFPYWQSLAWATLLKLLVAAGGIFLLCRALGLRSSPALLAAIAFPFSTYMVSWLAHPHINAYVLLPWMFLAAERLARRGRLIDVLALGAAGGLALLSGHPQSALIVGLATGTYLIWRLLVGFDDGRRRRVWRAAGGAAAALLAVALAAVMLLPFVEALAQSMDSARAASPLRSSTLAGLFFPEYWGRPDKYVIPGEPGLFPERVAYTGAIPLLLGIAALVARRPSSIQVFFAGLLAGALVIAISNPVGIAIRDLPVLDLVNLNRVLVLACFATAMLAAFGLEVALTSDTRQRVRLAAAAAVIAAAPAAAWLVTTPLPLREKGALRQLPDIDSAPGAEIAAVQLGTVFRWLLLAGALIGLVLLLLRYPGRRWIGLACVAVVALDLVSLGRDYHPMINLERAEPSVPAAVSYMQRNVGAQRISGVGESLGPNVASRYELRDARGHDLPVVERHLRLWLALGGSGEQRTLTSAPGSAPLLLDVFGVRYEVGPSAPLPAGSPLRVAFDRAGQAVYENSGELPRAWVAHDWRPSDSLTSSLRVVAGSSADRLRSAPVIEEIEPPPLSSGPESPRVRVVTETPTQVTLRARTNRPGQLVLHDTFYPGWKASVDGEPVEIKAANAAFRAVPLGSGLHEVRFEYRSTSVRAGATVSVLGLVMALMAAFVAIRQRRRPLALSARLG